MPSERHEPSIQLVDSVDGVADLLSVLQGSSVLYVDLEGVTLGRKGSLSLVISRQSAFGHQEDHISAVQANYLALAIYIKPIALVCGTRELNSFSVLQLDYGRRMQPITKDGSFLSNRSLLLKDWQAPYVRRSQRTNQRVKNRGDSRSSSNGFASFIGVRVAGRPPLKLRYL